MRQGGWVSGVMLAAGGASDVLLISIGTLLLSSICRLLPQARGM